MSPLTPRQALLLQPMRKQPHQLPRKPQSHGGLVPANKTLADALSPHAFPGVPQGHPASLAPWQDPLGPWERGRAVGTQSDAARWRGGWSLGKAPAGTGCPHAHGDVPHWRGGGISSQWLWFSRELVQCHSPPRERCDCSHEQACLCSLCDCCVGDVTVLLLSPVLC